jgi:hypothetical protein
MDKAGILVAVLMGALALGLAFAIMRPREGRVGPFVILFVLMLFAFEFIGRKYVLPQAQAMLSQSLPDEPLFAAIKKNEPATYDRLTAGYRTAIRNHDKDAFIKQSYEEMGAIAIKHIPTASDEAVTDFMNHALIQLKELRKKPGDSCFRFMFPKVSGPADLSNELPKPMLDANGAKLAAVINTSVDHPQQQPSDAEAQPLLQPVLEYLARTYGSELQMISNPAGPSVDRRRVCDISIDLYEHIGELPLHDRATVLKLMLKG